METFVFVSSIILLISTTLIIYLMCKHKKIRTLVASLVLHQVKEVDWKEIRVTFNDKKMDLPKIVVIKLWDKIKIRRLMNRKPLLFHLMLKQGITWFTL